MQVWGERWCKKKMLPATGTVGSSVMIVSSQQHTETCSRLSGITPEQTSGATQHHSHSQENTAPPM